MVSIKTPVASVTINDIPPEDAKIVGAFIAVIELTLVKGK